MGARRGPVFSCLVGLVGVLSFPVLWDSEGSLFLCLVGVRRGPLFSCLVGLGGALSYDNKRFRSRESSAVCWFSGSPWFTGPTRSVTPTENYKV